MSKAHREAKRIAIRVGLEVLAIGNTGGTHIKALVRRADGQQAQFIFPATPSDHRGLKNKEAELRRFASGRWNPVRQHEKEPA